MTERVLLLHVGRISIENVISDAVIDYYAN